MKLKHFMMGAAIAVMMSSCYNTHSLLSHNANLNETQVVLSKDNYEVVKRIEGKATARSVLGFGSHGKKALVSIARADMLSQANFIGDSKAVINENIEVNHKYGGILQSTTVTVSAYLIEFTK